MSKTLLLVNGQTVILTSDGPDPIVPSSPALTSALTGHRVEESQGQVKILTASGTNKLHQHSDAKLEGSESLVDGIKSNLVEVKVNGSEVPGFLVPQHGVGAKSQDQSVHEKKTQFELLISDPGEDYEKPVKGSRVEAGSFLRLHNTPLQSTTAKGFTFEDKHGNNLGGEVFTIATGTELMQASGEGKAGDGEQEENGVQDLGSIVRLPLAPRPVEVEGQAVSGPAGGGQEEQAQARDLSTLVAIIQNDDGTTQTIELSPEEAHKLNLHNLLSGNAASSQVTDHQLLERVEEPLVPDGGFEEHHRVETLENDAQIIEQGCSPGFPQCQKEEGQEDVTVNIDAGEADVSLGPFLLIPEYNADGSISMLQIRGSEAEATSDAPTTESVDHSSVLITDSQNSEVEELNKKAALPFPRPGQNMQKIRLTPQQQVKNHSSVLKTKNPDLKAVAVKSRPKVSGNTYLRDIAKRTKFRNLTSFFENRQENQDMDSTKVQLQDSAATSKLNSVSGGAGLRPVQVPTLEYTVGSGCSLLKTVPIITTAAGTLNSGAREMSVQLSDLSPDPSSSSSSSSSSAVVSEENQQNLGDCALTIKVSTGPINTAATAHAPPHTTPTIKCTEYTEAAAGGTLASADSTSLTSIVYCSSGGDDTPFTVHLPGGDNTKPLGSSENPIQLVQQGNTFQALQPVQERQLEQITALLQQRRITAPPTTHHDEIYDPKTNMKIVYKVVYPEDVLYAEDEEDEDFGYNREELWEGRTGQLEEKRRGRKPKDWKKAKLSEEEDVLADAMDESGEKKKPLSRTRSGRISRPPRHMMKDFKHLHPINFNDDAKDRDTASVGYLDYDDYLQHDTQEKTAPPAPVISDLPRRKKRVVPPLTRLRYTCATCGKLYMGRIDAHYKKFPDHCRPNLPSASDPKQTYSTIKTLSDPAKPSGDEGSEINKSVLSPTPGTQASETSGEPSLPMETLTTEARQPQDPQPQLPGDHPPLFDLDPREPVQLTPVRTRRGRGRRKGRARGGRGRPVRVTAPSAAPVTEPTKVLQKILSTYTSEDIQNAVGQRLFQNLSPWQLLCYKIEAEGAWPKWQERLKLLESLLKECREEFDSQTEPQPEARSHQSKGQVSSKRPEHFKKSCGERGGGGSSNSGFQSLINLKEEPLSDCDSGRRERDSSPTQHTPTDTSFKVSNYIASVLGVNSCEYQLKQPLHRSPDSPLLDSSADPDLTQASNNPHLINLNSGKRLLEVEEGEGADLSTKRKKESQDVLGQEVDPASLNSSSRVEETSDKHLSKKSEDSDSIDSVSKVLEAAATCSLELSSYGLSTQMTPENSSGSSHTQVSSASTASMLGTPEVHSQLSTTLSSSSFNMSLSSEGVASSTSTTLTTSHPAPCVTSASSLPLEIPHFPSHGGSPPALSSCLPLTNMDATFIPASTMPQVNTIQQMPLGDLDITAEDLPRLLSEGTGLVVGGGGDGCDAPKLLDTSGDTSDLSEMLFKLQEATAGIGQSQETNLGSQMYQENVNAGGAQLIAPQGLDTHSVGLTSQGYSAVGGALNSHTPTNLALKLDTTQASGQSSMPLLTFSGALNSEFNSTSSGLSQAITRTEDSSKIQDVLGQANNQEDRVAPGRNEAAMGGDGDAMGGDGDAMGGDGERINIAFSSSHLGISEFEDLLKR